MVKFSKLFFYLTVALIFIWQLPWCYSFFTAKASQKPFTLYSCVVDDFVMSGKDNTGKFCKSDLQGNQYTDHQFDSILPCFYSRQLLADDRFPETIKNTPVTYREVQSSLFTFRSTPYSINAPGLNIFPLLESMSGRVDLKMPDDVFRITNNAIEFVDAETNSVNKEKSASFTDMLNSKGFAFPASYVAGNPTSKKEYDEGYLILDNKGKLFHLKQTKGRPYVRHISLPDGVSLKYLYVTEFRDKNLLGLVSDEENNFYALKTKSCELAKIDIKSFDPEKNAITIIGNMFDWTIRVTSVSEDIYYAIDANDFSCISTYNVPSPEDSFADVVSAFLPPVKIHFNDGNSKYVFPRLRLLE